MIFSNLIYKDYHLFIKTEGSNNPLHTPIEVIHHAQATTCQYQYIYQIWIAFTHSKNRMKASNAKWVTWPWPMSKWLNFGGDPDHGSGYGLISWHW